MGVQTQSNSDTLRTQWTPAMDRYFIDLMLDEIRNGSKIDDHLFSKRAWNNMTLLFNAKFESHYDKEVLKNRHKSLRKLYRSVSKLLDENGFSWDSTLQMVIAKDDVWDDHIKAHSDARSYRTKTIPYYSDLGEIYKTETDNVDHDSNLSVDSPETKPGGMLEELKSPVSSVLDKVDESSSLIVENLDMSDHFLLPPNSPRSNSECMLDYPEMKIDEVFEGSKSPAIDVVYEGDLIDNVEIDMSYEDNMDHQSLMPSSPRSNDDGTVGLAGTTNCGMLEGSGARTLPVMHPDQDGYEQELTVNFDGDIANEQRIQQAMAETLEIRVNEMSNGLTPNISDLSMDMADHQKVVEVTMNDEPNEQLGVSVSPERSNNKCGKEAVHERINVEDEEENGDHGVSPDINTANGVSRLRTSWTPTMDRYFIDLLLDQVRAGNMIDITDRKQAWKNMLVLFNTKFSFHYDTDILKNRYKTLRRRYNSIKFLLDRPGFNWDDTKKMVTADDFVWHNYLKKHPDAGQYRTRVMPYYNDLCSIYKDTVIDGTYSSSDQNNKRRITTHSAVQDLKKLRSDGDMGMADTLREMASAVSSLVDKKKENTNIYSIEKAICSLQSLPDIDDDLLLDACDFFEDEKMGKTFLALDVSLRKKWLMRKLRA